MNEKLENHIVELFERYEKDKATDLEHIEENEQLCSVIAKEIKLLQSLDEKQAELFREYGIALITYNDAIKTEYFSAGFLYGLYTDKNKFE